MWQVTGLDKHVPQSLGPTVLSIPGCSGPRNNPRMCFPGTATFLALALPANRLLGELLLLVTAKCSRKLAMGALPEQLILNFSKLPEKLTSNI